MSLSTLEKNLDKAFQRLAIDKRCHFCFKPATCVHHLIRRANKLYRWNAKNGLFLCHKCHFDIHNGNRKEPDVEFERDDLRSYLMRNGLIYKEFLELKARELGI
jgi:hypothetical protein